MGKRKKKKLPNLSIVAFVLSIVAVGFIFAPALLTSNLSYSGIEMTFGKEDTYLYGLGSGKLAFSVMALAVYVLPIVAAVFLVVFKNKYLPVISAVLIAASFVMMIMLPSNIPFITSFLGVTTYNSPDWERGWGMIVSMVLLALSFAFSTYEGLRRIAKL